MEKKHWDIKTVLHYAQISLICLPIVLLIILNLTAETPAGVKDDYEINPLVNSRLESNSVTLYFRYAKGANGSALLSGEAQKIEVAASETLEYAIVRTLISGPQSKALVGLINPDTKVLSVTKNKDCYFVTLSKEFLEPFGGYRGMDAQSGEQALYDRKLAVYSIVNSLTELGVCSRVQILVDVDGTGNGQRVPRKDLGFSGANGDQPIESLGRDANLILTTIRSVGEMLELIMSADYANAYKCIAQNSGADGTTPSEKELIALVSGSNTAISTYDILDETVASDGSTAVVTINVTVKYGSETGLEMRRTLLPMKLIRENEVWKIAYVSLQNIYE